MKVLSPASYRVMPWKNGGGVTTELHVHPEGGEFQWRASIADVALDGPFSRFDGYDRHIMLIEGHGMVLEGGPQGQIDVTTRHEPRHFSGDWDVTGRLVHGPVRDFNLISRRRDCRGSLHCIRIDGECAMGSPGSTMLLYVLKGALRCEAGELPTGHAMLLQPGEQVMAAAARQSALAALCEVQPCSSS